MHKSTWRTGFRLLIIYSGFFYYLCKKVDQTSCKTGFLYSYNYPSGAYPGFSGGGANPKGGEPTYSAKFSPNMVYFLVLLQCTQVSGRSIILKAFGLNHCIDDLPFSIHTIDSGGSTVKPWPHRTSASAQRQH